MACFHFTSLPRLHTITQASSSVSKQGPQEPHQEVSGRSGSASEARTIPASSRARGIAHPDAEVQARLIACLTCVCSGPADPALGQRMNLNQSKAGMAFTRSIMLVPCTEHTCLPCASLQCCLRHVACLQLLPTDTASTKTSAHTVPGSCCKLVLSPDSAVCRPKMEPRRQAVWSPLSGIACELGHARWQSCVPTSSCWSMTCSASARR